MHTPEQVSRLRGTDKGGAYPLRGWVRSTQQSTQVATAAKACYVAACCTFTIHVAFQMSHLKKKIGRLRHVVVARVRNSPTWVLCLAVSGFPAPNSLETLHAIKQEWLIRPASMKQ